jgi:hypothetical protein
MRVLVSWLLFLDESGHDHRTMPYEVRGGVAIHASKLWPFLQAVRTLEQSTFGAYLHDFGSEIKGCKLLAKERFRWDQQGPRFDEPARRKHALNFLNNSKQGRTPRRDEFTAFGQACLILAEGLMERLRAHDAKLFAAIIPRVAQPERSPIEYLRKDHVFLFERFFYFLESVQETGLLVMDASDKMGDRDFVRRMERYFMQTTTGRQRTSWIVPTPLFVDSDMAYGVQVADLCIYCLNWGYRQERMTEPTRKEIEPFVWLLEKIIWHGEGYRAQEVFKTHGVVYVPDPYEPRRKKEGGNALGATVAAPRPNLRI